ncbi:Hpt domain-containing protein [Gimibacter soli]|uniref:Hpt domain-containing protein n=1 Tax=Gimibacter soli TaxID=3024400 RepID=A0AAE9XNH8_9PROT|nr:Hpt domain-containing protein [Gimibacter soli]WCL54267.1 Hpt domain-containing protein [Gimibacter soli]
MEYGRTGDQPFLDPEIIAEFTAFVSESARTLARCSAEMDTRGREAATQIFEHSHNLKGIGSTFGFALLTDVAGGLCHYIKYVGPTADFRTDVVRAHVDAIIQIIDTPMPGDGGPEGERLLARLQVLAGR